MANRPQRVASLLREEIGSILVREYGDRTAAFVTVTDVEISSDLRIAKVFISILGSKETQVKTMEFLESEKGHIRGMVGSRIRLRFVPELLFVHDTTLERVDRINALLKKIHDNNTDREQNG